MPPANSNIANIYNNKLQLCFKMRKNKYKNKGPNYLKFSFLPSLSLSIDLNPICKSFLSTQENIYTHIRTLFLPIELWTSEKMAIPMYQAKKATTIIKPRNRTTASGDLMSVPSANADSRTLRPWEGT